MAKGHGRRTANRAKVSTTVAPETLAYINELIDRGEAANLAEALDLMVKKVREEQSRAQLDAAWDAYYNSLTDTDVEEQRAWGEFAGRALFEAKSE